MGAAHRPYQPPFLYSREQYEEAVRTYADAGLRAPECMRFKFPRRIDALIKDWSTLPLESKITEIAGYIGGFVRGDVRNPAHVITYGYEMLCRRDQLSDR